MSAEPEVLTSDGKPFRRPARSDRCPTCGSGLDKRKTVEAMGGRSESLCLKCGHRFEDEEER